MGTRSGAYELNHECTSERVPMVYYRVNTRVQMFYFDSKTCVPLKCPELAFWKVLFSFSLKTRGFQVTIFISILTRPYISNVLH